MDTDKKVAAVVTQYLPRGSADAIVGKILEGYAYDGKEKPGLKLVSLVEHAPHPSGTAESLSHTFHFDYYGYHGGTNFDQLVQKALFYRPSWFSRKRLVDGVILVCEQGPYDRPGPSFQTAYPKRLFFNAVFNAFRHYERVCPVFNFKHLAVATADAFDVYRRANDLNVRLMAGSALPLSWRMEIDNSNSPAIQTPFAALPMDAPIAHGVQIAAGDAETHGLHALETLQCMMECRLGGESGIADIQYFPADRTDKMWRDYFHEVGAGEEPLIDRIVMSAPHDPAINSFPSAQRIIQNDVSNFICLIKYQDRTKSTIIMANGWVQEIVFNDGGPQINIVQNLPFVCRMANGSYYDTKFTVQNVQPTGIFKYLVQAIEYMIRHGEPVYRVERTLLTTCILDHMMKLRAGLSPAMDQRVKDIKYQPLRWPNAREEISKHIIRASNKMNLSADTEYLIS